MEPTPEMTLRQTAELAKLALGPAEEARMTQEIAEILRFARQLSALDLTDVPVSAHVAPLCNVLRDDQPSPSLTREEVLGSAPAHTGDCIAVPRAVDG